MRDPSISPNSKWTASGFINLLLSLDDSELILLRKLMDWFSWHSPIHIKEAKDLHVPDHIKSIAMSKKIQGIKELRAYYGNQGRQLSLGSAKLAIEIAIGEL